MSKYLDLRTGEKLTSDDPNRGIWYSAGCGYWTDDWSKLSKVNGIPCCPKCRMVGMQITAEKWFKGITHYEKEGHEGYDQFCREHKESCNTKMAWMARYEAWFRNIS